MEVHGFIDWLATIITMIAGLLVIGWFGWLIYGWLNTPAQPGSSSVQSVPNQPPQPVSQPAQPVPTQSVTTAAAAPKGKKPWGCIILVVIGIGVLFMVAYWSDMFKTYPVTRVTTTTSFTQDLKDGAAYVHSSVNRFYRSNTPLVAHTFGNVDIDSPGTVDGRASDCVFRMERTTCHVVPKGTRAIEAQGLPDTLTYCWARSGPTDTSEEASFWDKIVIMTLEPTSDEVLFGSDTSSLKGVIGYTYYPKKPLDLTIWMAEKCE